VRFRDDLRKCVVFFGYADSDPHKDGIECIGTGFLIEYDGMSYLLTAHHISHQLADNPFLLRINKDDGSAEKIHIDKAEWFFHPDKTVDLAIAPFILDRKEGYDVVFLGMETLGMTKQQFEDEAIGVGDFTYTIGLFRLFSGRKKAIPLCHFGTIAMYPDDERIPIHDWRDATGRRLISVEGFMVESQSLSGLSGSPVFVRPQTTLDPTQAFGFSPLPTKRLKESPLILWPKAQLRLLGLWQGSWTAPPDDLKAVQVGASGQVKVPVGMGIVVPCYKILELLETPEVKKNREDFLSVIEFNVAELDAVKR
jgi:hypothetical protein